MAASFSFFLKLKSNILSKGYTKGTGNIQQIKLSRLKYVLIKMKFNKDLAS